MKQLATAALVVLTAGCGKKPDVPHELDDLLRAADSQTEHAVNMAVRVCKGDLEAGLATNATATAKSYAPIFKALWECAGKESCVDPGTPPSWAEAEKTLADAERAHAAKTRAALAKVLASSWGTERRPGLAKLFQSAAELMPVVERVAVTCGSPGKKGEVSVVLGELEAKRAAYRGDMKALRAPKP